MRSVITAGDMTGWSVNIAVTPENCMGLACPLTDFQIGSYSKNPTLCRMQDTRLKRKAENTGVDTDSSGQWKQ